MIKPVTCRTCQGSGETVSGYPCPTCHGTGLKNQVIGIVRRMCPRISGIWPEPIDAWRNPDQTVRRNAFVMVEVPGENGKPSYRWTLAAVLDRHFVTSGQRVGNHELSKDGSGVATRLGVMAQQVTITGREEDRLNGYDPEVMQAGTGRSLRCVLQLNEDGLWPRYLRGEFNVRRSDKGRRITMTSRDIVLEKSTV